MDIASLLALIDAFKEARGISDARVSTLVFNDGSRIAQIRAGGDVGTRRLRRAVCWFHDNWPPLAMWPPNVDVPDGRIAVVASDVRSLNAESDFIEAHQVNTPVSSEAA